MCKVTEIHRAFVKGFPHEGNGLDAFVDSSDTGYSIHGVTTANAPQGSQEEAKPVQPSVMLEQKPLDKVNIDTLPVASKTEVVVGVQA